MKSLCKTCEKRYARGRKGFCGSICYQKSYYSTIQKRRRYMRRWRSRNKHSVLAHHAAYRFRHRARLAERDRDRKPNVIPRKQKIGYLSGYGGMRPNLRHLSGWREDAEQDRILAELEAKCNPSKLS